MKPIKGKTYQATQRVKHTVLNPGNLIKFTGNSGICGLSHNYMYQFTNLSGKTFWLYEHEFEEVEENKEEPKLFELKLPPKDFTLVIKAGDKKYNFTLDDAGNPVVTPVNEVVDIVRFIRPRADGEILSHRGTTLLFMMDYTKRTITVKWSVCNGDNFDKKEGVRYAYESTRQIDLVMPDQRDDGHLTEAGLTDWLMSMLDPHHWAVRANPSLKMVIQDYKESK